MENDILSLELDDNVGDGLGKINYNLLNINRGFCEANNFIIQNEKFLKDVEDLMDDLDVLLPTINYDFLGKLESTVQILSSYWNKLELTVQYPFNPINGYVSSLVAAGDFGELISHSDIKKQENMIADALVRFDFFATRAEAIDGIRDKDIIIVSRNNNGDFTKWQYLDDNLLFRFSIDKQDNFYFDLRLVDLYKIPYYSIISPKNIDLSIKGTTVDFDDKIIRQDGKAQEPDYNSISKNSYVNYVKSSTQERGIFGTSEEDAPIDVVRFTPTIKSLNEIIENNNPVFKAKIQKINDDTLENISQNPKINTICLKFLNNSYKPKNYIDGTIINVVMFLYSTIGLDTTKGVLRINYFDDDVTKVKRTSENLKKETVTKIAPSSNTKYDVNFAKNDVYVDRVVIVKYRKNSEIRITTNEITGKQKINVDHFWEFVQANTGSKYKKGDKTVKKLDNAPIYSKNVPTVNEIKKFPTQILTQSGDFIQTKAGDTYLIKT